MQPHFKDQVIKGFYLAMKNKNKCWFRLDKSEVNYKGCYE